MNPEPTIPMETVRKLAADDPVVNSLLQRLNQAEESVVRLRQALTQMHRRAQAAEAALPQAQELARLRVPLGPPRTRAFLKWSRSYGSKPLTLVEG